MKAIFHYSDGSTTCVEFPGRQKVAGLVRPGLIVDPTIVYFTGRLNYNEEDSTELCKNFTKWQHWCLQQTRTYGQMNKIEKLKQKKKELEQKIEELTEVLQEFERPINKLWPGQDIKDRSISDRLQVTNVLVSMYEEIENPS